MSCTFNTSKQKKVGKLSIVHSFLFILKSDTQVNKQNKTKQNKNQNPKCDLIKREEGSKRTRKENRQQNQKGK